MFLLITAACNKLIYFFHVLDSDSILLYSKFIKNRFYLFIYKYIKKKTTIFIKRQVLLIIYFFGQKILHIYLWVY